MVVTKELLKKLFAECNTLYFDDKLGKCDFSFFSKSSSNLGWYCAREDRKGRPNDKIWIGTSIIWTEDLLRRILIHEMIHMYVNRVEGHKHDGILGHGWRFRRQCRRIRKNYGIEALNFTDVEFIDPKFYPKLWEKILLWIIDR